ncbi:MAG: ion transporter [Lachnospiraceae bacterium]|nr:ion transporter [Lachnospiraceae bacterium]
MEQTKKRIFHVISIGDKRDSISRGFDIFIVVVILVNLLVTFADTFDELADLRGLFDVIELITIIIFTIEYILRLWTADYLYPDKSAAGARLAFVFSFYGLIDLLTFFPYYLPIMVPGGIVAFRILRVFRIFRLFKINAQYDAFNVITDVLNEKKSQLFSSICLLLMLMVASSLGMYSLEHDAGSGFDNAFSGIWWSTSAILTVGYGDIYPVTVGGRILAIIIACLGVGIVAIPTGIISAGFVERYTRIKQQMTVGEEHAVRFITSTVAHGHSWCGRKISEIVLPPQLLLVVILRGNEQLVPNGDTVLAEDDVLILAGKHYEKRAAMNLREMTIGAEHPWVNEQIRNLDISRQELIVSVDRDGKMIIPNGSTVIRKNDVVLVYHKAKETGEKGKDERVVSRAAETIKAGTAKAKQGSKKGK